MSLRVAWAWTWTALILALCWLPRSAMPVDEARPKAFAIPHLDKAVHFALFFGFAWLWAGARTNRPRAILAAATALAAISEFGQLMPFVHRDADWSDGLADFAGSAAGLGISLGLRRPGLGRAASGDRPGAEGSCLRIDPERTNMGG